MRILDLGGVFRMKPPAVFRIREISGRKLWQQRRPFLPPVTAAVVGVTLSIGAGLLVSQREDRDQIREFHSVAENQAGILQNGINQYLSRLVAWRALLNS